MVVNEKAGIKEGFYRAAGRTPTLREAKVKKNTS